MIHWLWKLLICLDYFGNILAPASRPGMTISAHAAMAALDGHTWGKWLSALLGRVEKDHCALALVGDADRAVDVLGELWRYLPAGEKQRIAVDLWGLRSER
jgi:hypothetical protein